jgi:hypothetical protein
MMNSRTQHRRGSTRHAVNGNGASPSILEIITNYLTDRLARSAMRRVKRGVHEVVRWTVLQLILGWIGAAIMTGGILLLLGSGVKGLEALRCPIWLAYLLIGVFAILVALWTMRGILWAKAEKIED